jgi:hypothetical protein
VIFLTWRKFMTVIYSAAIVILTLVLDNDDGIPARLANRLVLTIATWCMHCR